MQTIQHAGLNMGALFVIPAAEYCQCSLPLSRVTETASVQHNMCILHCKGSVSLFIQSCM